MAHLGKFVKWANGGTSEINELITPVIPNLGDGFLAEDGDLMCVL